MRPLRKLTVCITIATGMTATAATTALSQLTDYFEDAPRKAKYRDTGSNTFTCLPPCGGGQECC